MLPTDLDLARFCADTYSAMPNFDYIDAGAETGVWVAVKKLPDVDVIVFRGSDSIEDWWRDFDAAMVFEKGLGMVHAGFYENLDLTHSNIKAMVRPNPVITGHSLGAARAAIYSAMREDHPVKVALFGCPRPGAQALTDRLKGIPITSYKNRQDPVTGVPVPIMPALPYVQVREFIHVDGMVHSSFSDFLKDHHIGAYQKGLENGGF